MCRSDLTIPNSSECHHYQPIGSKKIYSATNTLKMMDEAYTNKSEFEAILVQLNWANHDIKKHISIVIRLRKVMRNPWLCRK